jgi:hypothetical protein
MCHSHDVKGSSWGSKKNDGEISWIVIRFKVKSVRKKTVVKLRQFQVSPVMCKT